MAGLKFDERGYPVPWFVAWINGKPDFRVIAPGKVMTAHERGLCWLCGKPRGHDSAFVIGPMCVINRVSSEPPSHLACAEFAVRVCPFLTRPSMQRNMRPLPTDSMKAPGNMILRNPGCTAIWVTRGYSLMQLQDGTLFELHEPIQIYWYAEGRTATRKEILASIENGMPDLERAAAADGAAGKRELDRMVERAAKLIPRD
jgi:hypothetical protein